VSIVRLPTYKFRITVLDCPYETWSEPFTQKLFAQMVDLKLRGFRTGYADGVLPVDGSDFVCTHLMVCAETRDELKPLLAYRSISESRARKHAMKFPGLALVESAKTPAPDHVQAVRRMVEHSQETGRSLRYCSSYTILPELREDRELVAQLKIYMTGMHALFHDEYQTAESLLGGVVRFKTDQYFASWGYERLALDGQELGTISNATLFGEPVYVMRLNQWSPHALQCAKETRELWNSRLTAQLPPGVPTG
jgi:hypothetical protein